MSDKGDTRWSIILVSPVLKEMMVPQATIQFNVKISFSIEKEGDMFVSLCPPLDVASQGNTENEAISNLRDAVGLFLESCVLMGTLDDVLKDCGFQPASRKANRDTDEEDHLLDVALPTLVARKYAQAHAG